MRCVKYDHNTADFTRQFVIVLVATPGSNSRRRGSVALSTRARTRTMARQPGTHACSSYSFCSARLPPLRVLVDEAHRHLRRVPAVGRLLGDDQSREPLDRAPLQTLPCQAHVASSHAAGQSCPRPAQSVEGCGTGDRGRHRHNRYRCGPVCLTPSADRPSRGMCVPRGLVHGTPRSSRRSRGTAAVAIRVPGWVMMLLGMGA